MCQCVQDYKDFFIFMTQIAAEIYHSLNSSVIEIFFLKNLGIQLEQSYCLNKLKMKFIMIYKDFLLKFNYF